MRPQSIVLFDRLFLASIALSVVSFAIGYDAIMEAMANDSTLQRAGLQGSGIVMGAAAAEYVIYLLLWHLIAHKAANWAKWVLVLLFAISLTSLSRSLGGSLGLSAMLGLGVYALRILAVVSLFRADAVAWLRGESTVLSDPVD